MRIFALAGFLFLLCALSSCTQAYTCGRQCYTFTEGNNIIEICKTPNVSQSQFSGSVDSLNALYGNKTSVFADSVNVSGGSQNAINTITKQLEQQGYTCNANTY